MERLFALLVLVVATSSCADESVEPAAADQPARVIESVSADRDGVIRILLSHDMEGLAGQSDWRTYAARFPDAFRKGQRLLAADVNAVIDGLFAGGATAVDVFDQHGAGTLDTVPDIPRGLLDPRAQHVSYSSVITAEIARTGNYDAVVAVGEHARTGTRGFAAHTVDLGIELRLNGMAVTETEFKAYQWGHFGVPLIFVAGDDRLQEDLRELPWIEYVVTKQATSASSAVLRPPEEVHAEMRSKAKRALENLRNAKVVRLSSPITVAIEAVPPASLASLRNFPGVSFIDESVVYTADSIDAVAFDRMIAIMEVARAAGQYRLLQDTLEATVAGRNLLSAVEEAYWIRWMDYESGRWKPAPTRPTTTR